MGICEVEHDFGWVCVCLGMSCWQYVGWFVLLSVCGFGRYFWGIWLGQLILQSIHDTREIDQTHVFFVVASGHFSVTGLF